MKKVLMLTIAGFLIAFAVMFFFTRSLLFSAFYGVIGAASLPTLDINAAFDKEEDKDDKNIRRK